MVYILRYKYSTSVDGIHQFPVMDEDISDEELFRNVEHLERTSQQEGGGALNREGYFNFKLT